MIQNAVGSPKFTLGQDSAQRLAKTCPGEFCYFTNVDARRKDASRQLEKYLKAGAIGIGAVRLPLECDAREMERRYDVARVRTVPVFIHCQTTMFAHGQQTSRSNSAKCVGLDARNNWCACWASFRIPLHLRFRPPD